VPGRGVARLSGFLVFLTCANLVRCSRLEIVVRRTDVLEVTQAAVRSCTIWTTLAPDAGHTVRRREAARTA
jgi:hypothetical protein